MSENKDLNYVPVIEMIAHCFHVHNDDDGGQSKDNDKSSEDDNFSNYSAKFNPKKYRAAFLKLVLSDFDAVGCFDTADSLQKIIISLNPFDGEFDPGKFRKALAKFVCTAECSPPIVVSPLFKDVMLLLNPLIQLGDLKNPSSLIA